MFVYLKKYTVKIEGKTAVFYELLIRFYPVWGGSVAVLSFDGDIFSDVAFEPAYMLYMVVLKMRN